MGFAALALVLSFDFTFALAFTFTLPSTLVLSLDLALAFFWLGILGVSLRSLGDSNVPRQFLLPHQQGYSALSFLV